jgi:hypothetical protein
LSAFYSSAVLSQEHMGQLASFGSTWHHSLRCATLRAVMNAERTARCTIVYRPI